MKEVFSMSTKQRPNTLYATPFSKAYWVDAAMELKNTKILVIAALLIALRVAMKWASVPLAPNLRINIGAPLVNALGAMIFGPVVAGLAACVSDTLGVILFPQGPYFFPCMFVEVAGSMIFAMYFYRAKITATRVILARFTMDLLVNICLNSAIMCWYFQVIYGKSYVAMILPAVIKNLCMFPIEAFLLALFLSIIIPITYRMGLTFDNSADRNSLKFNTRQFSLLLVLFAIGVASVVGYLFYHYDHTSLSKSYDSQERYTVNCKMTDVIKDESDLYDDDTLVTTVETAYRKFGKGYTTYHVAVYAVDESKLDGFEISFKKDQPAAPIDLEGIRGLSKSKAAAVAKAGVMERVATADIVISKSGEVLELNLLQDK